MRKDITEINLHEVNSFSKLNLGDIKTLKQADMEGNCVLTGHTQWSVVGTETSSEGTVGLWGREST